jgi:hypothetical protein
MLKMSVNSLMVLKGIGVKIFALARECSKDDRDAWGMTGDGQVRGGVMKI